MYRFCADSGCSLEDLPGTLNDMDGWWERASGKSMLSVWLDDNFFPFFRFLYLIPLFFFYLSYFLSVFCDWRFSLPKINLRKNGIEKMSPYFESFVLKIAKLYIFVLKSFFAFLSRITRLAMFIKIRLILSHFVCFTFFIEVLKNKTY